MVKICINCNAENLEEALFCKRCGTKLPTLKDIENARREEKEEADRKWKEEVRKNKEKNEALNETRRNEGSVSVYGSSTNDSKERGLTINSLSEASSNNNYPPHKRKHHIVKKDKKREHISMSIIIINLSIVLIIAMGALAYFYIDKEGISIDNITDNFTKNKIHSVENSIKPIDDIFIDKKRKLMWQDNRDCKKIILSWEDAKNYCYNLFLGNYVDWRIPMKYELESILDTDNNPAIKKGFHNVSKTFYWSTKIKPDSSFAWHIFFGKDGGTDYEDMKNLNSIRCVRNY